MVDRFNSYIYPCPPRPASHQRRHSSIRISAVLPSLKQSLERVDTLDPGAQDARRLMSIHLPGLIDRYATRSRTPIAASRTAKARPSTSGWSRASLRHDAALDEVAEQLARSDLAAFETQGRFIKSRYGETGHRERRRFKHIAIARSAGAAHDNVELIAAGADGGWQLALPRSDKSLKAGSGCRRSCRRSIPRPTGFSLLFGCWPSCSQSSGPLSASTSATPTPANNSQLLLGSRAGFAVSPRDATSVRFTVGPQTRAAGIVPGDHIIAIYGLPLPAMMPVNEEALAEHANDPAYIAMGNLLFGK